MPESYANQFDERGDLPKKYKDKVEAYIENIIVEDNPDTAAQFLDELGSVNDGDMFDYAITRLSQHFDSVDSTSNLSTESAKRVDDSVKSGKKLSHTKAKTTTLISAILGSKGRALAATTKASLAKDINSFSSLKELNTYIGTLYANKVKLIKKDNDYLMNVYGKRRGQIEKTPGNRRTSSRRNSTNTANSKKVQGNKAAVNKTVIYNYEDFVRFFNDYLSATPAIQQIMVGFMSQVAASMSKTDTKKAFTTMSNSDITLSSINDLLGTNLTYNNEENIPDEPTPELLIDGANAIMIKRILGLDNDSDIQSDSVNMFDLLDGDTIFEKLIMAINNDAMISPDEKNDIEMIKIQYDVLNNNKSDEYYDSKRNICG